MILDAQNIANLLPFADGATILQCLDLFNAHSQSGALSAASCHGILSSSNLDKNHLSFIWQSAVTGDGTSINIIEFVAMMYMVRNGIGLTSSNQDQLRKANLMINASGGSSRNLNLSSDTFGIDDGSNLRKSSFGPNVSNQQLSLQQNNTFHSMPTNPNQPITHQQRHSDTEWDISPKEKQQYDSIFNAYDPSSTGFIDGTSNLIQANVPK